MHGMTVCQHGIIHSQCRCMESHKNVELIRCDRNEQHRVMTPQYNTSSLMEKDEPVDKIAELKQVNERLQVKLDRLEGAAETLTLLMNMIREL